MAWGMGSKPFARVGRVEIDEHTLDLMVLLNKSGVLAILPEEMRGAGCCLTAPHAA